MNNDLISRSALKEEFSKLEGYFAGQTIERALAIIDRLRTDGHINNKEQGTLRRAILLPERPQGEWLWLGDNPNPNHKWSCNKCGRGVKEQENFCPNCGAKMQKGGAE